MIICGALGIWILVHLSDYAGYSLGALFSGQPIGELLSGRFQSPETLLSQGLGALLIGIPTIFLVLKFVWRRSIDEVGLKVALHPLVRGAILGLLLPPLIVAILPTLGAQAAIVTHSLTTAQLAEVLLGAVFWTLFVAMLEELVFRGIIFAELWRRWGWWSAALTSSAVFALAHLLTAIGRIPALEFGSTFVLITLASLLFCALYSIKEQLWLPIGFHWAWNLCLGSLVGATMSGKAHPWALFETALSGPGWLTGGAFGIEVSPVTAVLYLALTLYLKR